MGLLSGIKKVKREYDTVKLQGQRDYGAAQGLQTQALAGIDSLDSTESAMLAAGGLPQSVLKAFSIGQGRITDEATRDRASFGAELQQRAAASGGRMDPNASLAYEVDNNAALRTKTFDARNALTMNQADLALTNTNALLDAITRLRLSKLGAADAGLNRGSQMWTAGIDGRNNAQLGYSRLALGIASLGLSVPSGGGGGGYK